MATAETTTQLVDRMSGYRARSPFETHGFNPDTHYTGESYRGFLALWHIPRKSRVLDVATGRGEAADFLRDIFDARVIRTDLSLYPLHMQKHWYDAITLQKKHMAVAKATEQPFKSASFDAIHIKDAFVHVEDKYAFFAEMSRLLAPGGRLLIVSQRNPYNCVHLFYPAYRSGKALPPRSVDFWDNEEYVRIVRQITDNHMTYEGETFAAISPPYYSTMWGGLHYIGEQFNLIERIGVYISEISWTPPDGEDDWNHADRSVMEFIKK